MAYHPYDPIGALGGLFAPAFIRNDLTSEEAVAAWNARNRKYPPAPATSTFDDPLSVKDEAADTRDIRDAIAAVYERAGFNV